VVHELHRLLPILVFEKDDGMLACIDVEKGERKWEGGSYGYGQFVLLPDQNLLLVVGYRDGQRLCAALDVFNADTLWGRYWGTREYVPGLHFEACYYQAIEFCIERGIASFEGGAQGVHKLARGLLPTPTHSAHAIADRAFAAAIAEYCARERTDVAHSIDELEAGSPFRASSPARVG
jgi:hypothetical protein